jgi:hypothetical protein
MTDDIVARLRAGKFNWDCDEAADETERVRARVDLLFGYLRGALNVIEGFVACDTEDARAALEGEASDDAAARAVKEPIILTEKEKRSFEMSRELAQIYNRVMLERKLSDDAAT